MYMSQILYGTANFEEIRESNAIYVDKTMYIEKLEDGVDRMKTIHLRPPRFKTTFEIPNNITSW